MRRIAIVLWSGQYGGAETWSVALAKALKRQGCAVGVLILGDPLPLADRLSGSGVQVRSLGLRRGREVLAHYRRFALNATELGRDVAILPSGGYLSASLRLGGYPGSILAVEHGTLLHLQAMRPIRRCIRRIDAWSGAWAVDVHVVPSEYMLERLRVQRYGRHAKRIHLGLELPVIPPDDLLAARNRSCLPMLGFVGRLVRGKGVDVLLEAMSQSDRGSQVRLSIAGDGPERGKLEERARRLGLTGRVQFHGWIGDVAQFWRGCDVAVVPSFELVESFGMVAIEAMASGLPVIAARNGGLSEIVIDGETGLLFEPGDSHRLSQLISTYARDPELRETHGRAARNRALAKFSIDQCAAGFMSLVEDLSAHRDGAAPMAGRA